MGTSQVALVVKEPACQCRRHKKLGFDPRVWKIPWRRAWQPTLVLWPGESRGLSSLVGYSPWDRKESEATQVTEHMGQDRIRQNQGRSGRTQRVSPVHVSLAWSERKQQAPTVKAPERRW